MPENTTTLEVNGAKITVDTLALFRAWFEKNLGASSQSILPRIPTMPELNEGERYLGAILQPDGRVCHTILLPGDVKNDWGDSMKWAKSIGGDLPNRIEQAMFLTYMPEEFQKEAYWSNTQHAADSGYAWGQGFSHGYQYGYGKNSMLRARAVRRLVI